MPGIGNEAVEELPNRHSPEALTRNGNRISMENGLKNLQQADEASESKQFEETFMITANGHKIFTG